MSRFLAYPLAIGIVSLVLSGCGKNCDEDADERLAGAEKCDRTEGVKLCECHLSRVGIVLEDKDDCKDDGKWLAIRDREQASSKTQCCETPAKEAQKELDAAAKDACSDAEVLEDCCPKLVNISTKIKAVRGTFTDGCGGQSAAEQNIINKACEKMQVSVSTGPWCKDEFDDRQGRCGCKTIVLLSQCPVPDVKVLV